MRGARGGRRSRCRRRGRGTWARCGRGDRKSTRLNSSHSQISYAVFCLKKKNSKIAAFGIFARCAAANSDSLIWLEKPAQSFTASSVADECDAVVVGSRPTGLVAAITLARAGQSVLVLEANATIGGGARSAELTLPDFLHDVCSAVHPLAAASPFFKIGRASCRERG